MNNKTFVSPALLNRLRYERMPSCMMMIVSQSGVFGAEFPPLIKHYLTIIHWSDVHYLRIAIVLTCELVSYKNR